MLSFRRRAAALLCTLPFLLTACGGTDHSSHSDETSTSSSSPSAASNQADIAFATGMIPHHAQALEMVEMAAGRPVPEAVRELMDEIAAAQEPEIDELDSLLRSWGEQPVDPDSAEHGDHGGHSEMTGMMTIEQLADLDAASDDVFADLWMELMIAHHEGAVEMARTQIRDGESSEARDLAVRIIEAQEAEITAMRNLLGPKG